MNRKQKIRCINLYYFLFIILLTLGIVVKPGYGEVTGSTLSYGDYHYQSSNRVMSILGKIEWEFDSQNAFINLECMIMDKENFENFELWEQGYGVSYRYFSASDGDQYHDSGLWAISHRGEYYIVVKHDDTDAYDLTTFATIDAEYIGGYISVFLLVILIIVPLIITGLTIGIMLRRKKKGKQIFPSTKYIDNGSNEEKPIVKQESPEYLPENVFCWKCGTINASINNSCTNCGELLKHKN